ncbi:MAG: response regulator, partial [Proteobacteria bacterium]|nr:response regulator [Pseudomonadota bacterium]
MEPTKKVYKILIVDDDVDITEIIRETFAADHCTIYTAPDGVQAHRLILAERFDAIITDIMMPRLNGLDLVSIIKETPGNRAAHIFVMSGFLNNERIAMLAALKVVNIIVKPFEAAAL